MKTATTARYWLSWHQPTTDYRPISYPPNPSVLGWWCSGYDSDDVPILCALVAASSERAAWLAVRVDWPEMTHKRFAERKEHTWIPGNRFPLHDEWMKQRINGMP